MKKYIIYTTASIICLATIAAVNASLINNILSMTESYAMAGIVTLAIVNLVCGPILLAIAISLAALAAEPSIMKPFIGKLRHKFFSIVYKVALKVTRA